MLDYNPDWPEVDIFGYRNMRRLNWLGVSRCRPITVDALDLHIEELDAVHSTPRTRHQTLIPRVRPTWHRAASPLVNRDAHQLLRHTTTRVLCVSDPGDLPGRGVASARKNLNKITEFIPAVSPASA